MERILREYSQNFTTNAIIFFHLSDISTHTKTIIELQLYVISLLNKNTTHAINSDTSKKTLVSIGILFGRMTKSVRSWPNKRTQGF